MTAPLTGNAELCVDISETILTLLLLGTAPSLKGSGSGPFTSPFGAGTAQVTFSFQKLRIAHTLGRADVSFAVTVTPTVGGKQLSEMAGTATLLVPFELSPVIKGQQNVILDFTASSVTGGAVLTNTAQVSMELGFKTGPGWSPGVVDTAADGAVRAVITKAAGKVLPLTAMGALSINPAGGNINTNPVVFAGVQLATIAASATRPGVLSVLGAINPFFLGAINPKLKVQAAIASDHHVGIAVSQRGYHDQIFCPQLGAQLLGQSTPSLPGLFPVLPLCFTCGLAPEVPLGGGPMLQHLDTSFSTGRVLLHGVAFQDFDAGSATATFTGHVTLSIGNDGKIAPSAKIDDVDLDISLSWWAALLSVVFLGGLPLFAIGPADLALAPVVKSLVQGKINGVMHALPSPAFPSVKFDRVVVNPEALVIQGKSSLPGA